MKSKLLLFSILAVLLLAGCVEQAPPLESVVEPEPQESVMEEVPEISVNDQEVLNSQVFVSSVFVLENGWIAIHADDEGKPGQVIGQSSVVLGENLGVVVSVNSENATPVLYAMLHVDHGEENIYEFPGVDSPVFIGDDIVVKSFEVTGLPEKMEEFAPSVVVSDQETVVSTVTIDEVVASEPGWMAIHVDVDGKPGTVIGQTQVEKGVNNNVLVTIDLEQATSTLFAMLHVDRGEEGTYEFPGDDVPVFLEDVVVVTPFTATIPVEAADLIEFMIVGDDRAFYIDTISIESITVPKNVDVRITFMTAVKGVYFGGLDFTGCGIRAAGLNPGDTRTVTLNVDKNCEIRSTWPATSRLKDILMVIVE